MVAGNKQFVNGVEQIELAVLDPVTGVAGEWVRFENIAMDTVTHTSNADNKTNIFAEDKDVAVAILTDTGDPDTFGFGGLEISTENFAKLFNTEVDLATSTVTVLAKRREAKLAVRLTTRPINGVKKVITYPNTQCSTVWSGNFTKNALMVIQVTASLLAFMSVGGKDAIYTMQTVKEDGTVINGNPPVVSAGADSTTTTPTKALTGTATATSPKTIVSTLWTQTSGPNTATMTAPNALSNTVGGLITGVYIFQLTVVDSDGVSKSATTKVTATIA